MTIGVSIIHFVIKVPKLVQMIVTMYRVQGYQVPIVKPRLPQKIQYCHHEIQFFLHFHIRRRWFPAHHRDRLVRYCLFNYLFQLFIKNVSLALEFTASNFYFEMCVFVWAFFFKATTLKWICVIYKENEK